MAWLKCVLALLKKKNPKCALKPLSNLKQIGRVQSQGHEHKAQSEHDQVKTQWLQWLKVYAAM